MSARMLTVDSAGNVQSIVGNSGTSSGVLVVDNLDGAIIMRTQSADSVIISTNNTTRVTVNSSGNVGIGTTSPSVDLHVSAGTSGDAELRIEADTDNSEEGDVPYLSFAADGGILEGVIGLNDNTMTFASSVSSNTGFDFRTGTTNTFTNGNDVITNTTSRVFIDADGNVGIGTTSPSYALDVNGDVNFNGSQLHLRGTGNYPNALNFHTSGTEGYYWHMSAPRETESHAWKLWWYDGSTFSTALTVDTDGDTTTGGALNTNTINLNTSVHLTNVDADGSMRVQGNNGYIDIGPKNSSFCHIYTDRASFYFNKSTLYANSTSNKIWHRGDLKGAAVSVSMNSSGYGSLLHGLGTTPDWAFIGARTTTSSGNDNQLAFPIVSATSTTLNFRGYEIDTSGNSGATVSTIYNATVYVYYVAGNQ